MPDSQEALREQAALLDDLTDHLCLALNGHHGDRGLCRRLARVVLPVVQAHTQALDAEWRDLGGAYLVLGNDLTMARNRAENAEELLASLRDAVSRLADDLEAEARDWRAHDFLRIAKRGAARRLRSLLPQEG